MGGVENMHIYIYKDVIKIVNVSKQNVKYLTVMNYKCTYYHYFLPKYIFSIIDIWCYWSVMFDRPHIIVSQLLDHPDCTDHYRSVKIRQISEKGVGREILNYDVVAN